MSSSPQWELQTALKAALDGDGALGALVNGVFDDVPGDTPTPYVAFGEAQIRDRSTKTERLQEITVTLDVWSDYAGRFEVAEIQRALLDILNFAPLVLASHKLLSLSHQSDRISRTDDGRIQHGVSIYRALVQEL